MGPVFEPIKFRNHEGRKVFIPCSWFGGSFWLQVGVLFPFFSFACEEGLRFQVERP